MSENEPGEPDEPQEIVVGRLTGKTTTHSLKLLITNPDVGRNSYFVIYGDEGEEGEKKNYMLGIREIWQDKKGLMAKVQVIGERPQRPFERGSEIYLATEEQITKLLGIHNPPEESISIGNLIGYPIDIQLLVKNFGRIFITGKSGSGKSYTMGVLCEEFLKKGIPVVIIDRHGEYGSLKVARDEQDEEAEQSEGEVRICPNCENEIDRESEFCEFCGEKLPFPESEESSESQKTAESEEETGESRYIDKIIEFADLNINKGGDIDIEYLFSLDITDVVAPNLCTIINLRGMELEVQEIVAGRILRKLYQASVKREIPPFYLFLDEAHLFAGKKRTETSEVVKLFSQEGRKFGANLVLGTQRPQLLDTTIRAQAGTWVIHQLSDVNDIKITIQSAEDLNTSNKNDISGLDKGESIICGEAIGGVPLFVKIRRRETKHGGMGFNPLDFLPEQTVEELQKRKERILGTKSAEELEQGRHKFQELLQPKSVDECLDEIVKLKAKNDELTTEVQEWKQKCTQLEVKGKPSEESGDIKELQTELKVWKEKYKLIKDKLEAEPSEDNTAELNEKIIELKNEVSSLKSDLRKWKDQYKDAMQLAEKTIKELKRYKK